MKSKRGIIYFFADRDGNDSSKLYFRWGMAELSEEELKRLYFIQDQVSKLLNDFNKSLDPDER